jgi:hypothetical protein
VVSISPNSRADCHLAKLANGPRRYFDARVHVNPHPIRQATKRELERSNAFGFVSHEGSPVVLGQQESLIRAERDGLQRQYIAA